MVTTPIQRVNLNMLTAVHEITRSTYFSENREQNHLEQRLAWLVSKASPFLSKAPTKNLPTAVYSSSYCIIITCYFPVFVNFMNGLAQ